MSTPANLEDPPLESVTEATNPTVPEYLAAYWTRVRGGDLGSLPIILGLIVIAFIFATQSDVFLSAPNFVNLIRQTSGLVIIAIGVVFVLLVAEIDLSVAFVSAVIGVSVTLLLRESGPDWVWWIAIPFGLMLGAIIGFMHGFIITKAHVPSFVVTLAGLLGWSGIVLILTTEFTDSGTILIQDDVVIGIANAFFTDFWGWVLGFVAVAGFAGQKLLRRRGRSKAGLPVTPILIVLLQVFALAAVAAFAVSVANSDRGVPMVGLLVLLLLVFWTFIASRTRFGRHVYAVGGNPEAANRAGINVDRVKIAVFMIASFMAGVGGIVLASRLRSVDPGAGGGNLLLNAIAAAVIGGTSLFGGRGMVVSALLGALVIASLDNGLGLIPNLPSGVKFVVTSLVLLAAVLVDSFTRRAQRASGIA
ncbi:MAG: ABC transporter permease [Actinobacteria bacterium]|nr:ABC transporter permease [Actinomycetota bacterium]